MENRLFLVCLLTITSVAQEQPKTMTKMEVVLQSPDAPPGSFATKPKVMYRAGTRYCRTDEQPDPENGIHGLLIISEPDYWMVNLFPKTAKHGVDPGPTFNCKMPIFADSPTLELEFGHELEYFKGKGVVSRPGPVLQTKQTTAYTLDVDEFSLALFTYGSPERPLAVARIRGDKKDIFWFSGYGDVPFDAKLFAKPVGVKIEELKP